MPFDLICTGRTDNDFRLTTDVFPETWRLCLQAKNWFSTMTAGRCLSPPCGILHCPP